MKKILLTIATASIVAASAFADTWVSGYYRSDGTYVQGHYRSSPNQYKYDNYSTWGNVNPYTGEKGYQYKSECQYNSYC